jgi:hypothetical protein
MAMPLPMSFVAGTDGQPDTISMKRVSAGRVAIVASGFLFVTGCGMHATDGLEERNIVRPVLAEFEQVVGKSRTELQAISNELNRKLADAQRVHDGGRTIKNAIADFLVSGEGAQASARMTYIRDTVFEAYTEAKDEIRQIQKNKNISRQTTDWANLQVERIWSEYYEDRLGSGG